MRLLPLLLVLAGCAATGTDGPSRDQEALSRELAGRAAGEAEFCIRPASSSAGLTVVDSRTLTYREGRTLWVNRLPDECPGLRPLDTLIVELHGNRYCRHDRFRSIQSGSSIPGPTCLLGDFVPYRARG
jgi:hypothetical protein